MSLHVDIQTACSEPVPDEDDIRSCIAAALAGTGQRDPTDVSVRLVGEAEMSRLNQDYRGKAGPTNVLSFPCDLPAGLDLPLLGDIVICAPVVIREAGEQGKTPAAHWAHMLVHGTLHLLGYDHVLDQDAVHMEALESRILDSLDYPCPYQGEHTREQASG